MAELVTIADARDHLRIDDDAYDNWLTVWIGAVSDAVLLWLKEPWRAYVPSGEVDANGDPTPATDPDGNPIVRPTVRAAALVELARLRRDVEGDPTAAVPSHWGHGYVLGVGATSLLSALRKSTVA